MAVDLILSAEAVTDNGHLGAAQTERKLPGAGQGAAPARDDTFALVSWRGVLGAD